MRRPLNELGFNPWALIVPVAMMILAVVPVACGPNSTAQRASVDLETADGGGRGGIKGPGASGGANGSGPSPSPGAVFGTACGAGTECQSGQCVDGRCCDSACAGICQSCDQPGAAGRCTPLPQDTDPGNECEPELAETCGRDGMCDGAGACRKHAAGVMCGPGGCEVATQKAPSTCDGMGICQPGASKSCAPAVCIEQSCGDPCAVDADCKMMGFFCDEGTCRLKRDMAAACKMDNQCASGFCADGVCCATACKEKCQACNVEGTVGTCSAVVSGQDPKNECPVMGITTCSNAGGCDGKGGCRQHAAGTFCAPATCTGSTVTEISTCDGNGACKPGPKRECAPFVCNGATCWTACSTKDQCKAPRICDVNVCK